MKNFIILLLFLNSCVISHNVPSNQTPNENIIPNITKVFVDQNGSFYPNNWQIKYGNHPKNARRYAYSLNTIAIQKNLEQELADSERSVLENLKQEISNKNRIFILVHGYNNDESSAQKSFNKIQEKIDYDCEKDLFIQYYWDGLVSASISGSLKIWFNATGYSQLAGEFGLRKILNLIENKEVIMISHSRGASVILSSLSNPPYSKNFIEKTKEYHNIDIGNPILLSENKNIINCILLAPAIGLIDFKDPDIKSYRLFSDQVKNIHITINKTDPNLKKYIGNLSDNFNPTNLGYSEDIYLELTKAYKNLSFTDYTGMKSHAFMDYINNDKFIDILKQFNVINNG